MRDVMIQDYIGAVPKDWQYDEDTGHVMCRCPECEGRLLIGLYNYHNPYRFCPYCGLRLSEGKIVAKRCEVYGRTREEELETRRRIEEDRKRWDEKYGSPFKHPID